MRPRDFERVASSTPDLLVIGAGIDGLAIALEGASRGLRTTVIDAADFGVGTSFSHQNTAYGVLHAPGTARLGRARRRIRERRALARAAPWLLRPLPFIVGTYRSMTRGRLALRAVFKIDSWIGRDRNDGVEPELHLPAARLVSRAATLRLFPGVRQERLTGGAQWYDYQVLEHDRLTMAFAAAADHAGADVANYVEPSSAIRDAGRIAGVRVRDVLTGTEAEIRAGFVVNAAGEHAGRVMRLFGVSRPSPLAGTLSLVTSKRASDIAVAAPAADGRMLTLVPWKGRAILGNGRTTLPGPPGTPVQSETSGVREADVEAFIAEVNRAFPALKLQREEVTLVHHGAVPVVTDGRGRAVFLSEPQVVDHAGDGAAGAVSVFGAHSTAARTTARKVAALAARTLGRRLGAPRSETTVLPGAGIADHEALAIERGRRLGLELPLAQIRHLTERYAEHAAVIVGLMASDERLRALLSPDHPHAAAEVVFAIRHEMAARLSDIVIRRLGLGAAGYPGAAVVRAAASIAASELDWNASRTADEIAGVPAG